MEPAGVPKLKSSPLAFITPMYESNLSCCFAIVNSRSSSSGLVNIEMKPMPSPCPSHWYVIGSSPFSISHLLNDRMSSSESSIPNCHSSGAKFTSISCSQNFSNALCFSATLTASSTDRRFCTPGISCFVWPVMKLVLWVSAPIPSAGVGAFSGCAVGVVLADIVVCGGVVGGGSTGVGGIVGKAAGGVAVAVDGAGVVLAGISVCGGVVGVDATVVGGIVGKAAGGVAVTAEGASCAGSVLISVCGGCCVVNVTVVAISGCSDSVLFSCGTVAVSFCLSESCCTVGLAAAASYVCVASIASDGDVAAAGNSVGGVGDSTISVAGSVCSSSGTSWCIGDAVGGDASYGGATSLIAGSASSSRTS